MKKVWLPPRIWIGRISRPRDRRDSEEPKK
jgi:hypothetical protein